MTTAEVDKQAPSLYQTGPEGDCGTSWFYFENNCYKLYDSLYYFSSAASMCANDKASLVSIDNKAENEYVATLVARRTKFKEAWIGLMKTAQGNFTWRDGRQAAYTNWLYKRPSGSGSCVQMIGGGEWNNLQCFHRLQFVCEKVLPEKEGIDATTSLMIKVFIPLLCVFVMLCFVAFLCYKSYRELEEIKHYSDKESAFSFIQTALTLPISQRPDLPPPADKKRNLWRGALDLISRHDSDPIDPEVRSASRFSSAVCSIMDERRGRAGSITEQRARTLSSENRLQALSPRLMLWKSAALSVMDQRHRAVNKEERLSFADVAEDYMRYHRSRGNSVPSSPVANKYEFQQLDVAKIALSATRSCPPRLNPYDVNVSQVSRDSPSTGRSVSNFSPETPGPSRDTIPTQSPFKDSVSNGKRCSNGKNSLFPFIFKNSRDRWFDSFESQHAGAEGQICHFSQPVELDDTSPPNEIEDSSQISNQQGSTAHEQTVDQKSNDGGKTSKPEETTYHTEEVILTKTPQRPRVFRSSLRRQFSGRNILVHAVGNAGSKPSTNNSPSKGPSKTTSPTKEAQMRILKQEDISIHVSGCYNASLDMNDEEIEANNNTSTRQEQQKPDHAGIEMKEQNADDDVASTSELVNIGDPYVLVTFV